MPNQRMTGWQSYCLRKGICPSCVGKKCACKEIRITHRPAHHSIHEGPFRVLPHHDDGRPWNESWSQDAQTLPQAVRLARENADQLDNGDGPHRITLENYPKPGKFDVSGNDETKHLAEVFRSQRLRLQTIIKALDGNENQLVEKVGEVIHKDLTEEEQETVDRDKRDLSASQRESTSQVERDRIKENTKTTQGGNKALTEQEDNGDDLDLEAPVNDRVTETWREERQRGSHNKERRLRRREPSSLKEEIDLSADQKEEDYKSLNGWELFCYRKGLCAGCAESKCGCKAIRVDTGHNVRQLKTRADMMGHMNLPQGRVSRRAQSGDQEMVVIQDPVTNADRWTTPATEVEVQDPKSGTWEAGE